jgi:sialic acid synthase SpsE
LSKVFIIAEIGSNFDNNLENAKKYIRSLASIGVDAVKAASDLSETISRGHRR